MEGGTCGAYTHAKHLTNSSALRCMVSAIIILLGWRRRIRRQGGRGALFAKDEAAYTAVMTPLEDGEGVLACVGAHGTQAAVSEDWALDEPVGGLALCVSL